MSLKNKKVLICRNKAQAKEMADLLTEKKAMPVILSLFKFELLTEKQIDQTKIRNLSENDWLILSSINGVKFFHQILLRFNIKSETLQRVAVAAVGIKTRQYFTETFPDIQVRISRNNLQDLLNSIAQSEEGKQLKVLHCTSRQSVENIQVKVPANLMYDRCVIYQSVPAGNNSDTVAGNLENGKFDLVFFSSPSSFNYFIEQFGKNILKKCGAVAVPGATTARFIESSGIKVNVVPDAPESKKVIDAIEAYFKS